jgi:O-antigen/teichoic acid export membrane protein
VGARRRRAAAAVASVPGAGRLAVAARQARRALHSGAGPGSLPPDVERGAGARSLRQVARDAGALALGGAAAQALTVLVAPILTRLYDPAAIGAAGVLTGAMAFVGLIACLRFDMAIPLARGSRAAAQVCGACVVTGVAVTAVAAVLAAVAGDDLCDAAGVPQVAPYVWLVPVHTAIASVGLVGAGLLMRRRRFAGLGGVRFAQAAGQSATQLGAGAAGAGAAAAWFAGGVTAGAAAASVTAATAGLAGLSSRAGARAREGLRGARQALRRWRRFAAWSSGAAALQGLALAVPTVLVAGLYGAHEAGLFVLTQRVLGLPIAVAGEAAGAAWFGTAAQIVREDRGSLREPLAAVTRTMLLVGGVAVVAIMVAGPPLFGPVFGDEWTDGGVLVLVLAPLHFSLFAAVPAGQTLQARGRTDLLMGVAAGRLLAPFAGIAGGHALGLGFTASVGLYAAAMALVSLGNAALAWRVSGTVAQ